MSEIKGTTVGAGGEPGPRQDCGCQGLAPELRRYHQSIAFALLTTIINNNNIGIYCVSSRHSCKPNFAHSV